MTMETTTKDQSISAAGFADVVGERIKKEIEAIMAKPAEPKPADPKPADPKPADPTVEAPKMAKPSEQLQAAISNAMSELDKAGGLGVIMAKDDAGRHIFESLTSPEAKVRFEKTAQMSAGILSPIERAVNPLVPNVPVGSLALGAFSGLLIGEVIDGFTPATGDSGEINFANVAVKGVAAVVLITMGKPLFSNTAAQAGAAILVAQILADVLPIDEWIARLKGVFNGQQATAREAQDWLHRQPDPITGDTGHDIIGDVF